MKVTFQPLKGLGIFFALIVLAPVTRAQHQELQEKPAVWKTDPVKPDNTSLLAAFRRGKAQGHFRYFFMYTNNEGRLTDYGAHAIGGGLKYETGGFHGFQLGIGGYFIYNLHSSDLSAPDPVTHQYNRYEIGLFDIQHPANRHDINRLEEFYLSYRFKQFHIRFGKQALNTPFVNLQDGRMRATVTEGIWLESESKSNWNWEGGYLYRISPRSTVSWFSVASSIGIYSAGVNPDGTKSGYAGNLQSAGLFLAGASYKNKTGWMFRFHQLLAANLFQSSLLQVEWDRKKTVKPAVFAGVQLIPQFALNKGGNLDPAKTYFTANGHSLTLSARAGWRIQRWESSLNYTRITKAGRYLMPREWGRDPFYTFLPRERNEGFGDVHAVLLKTQYSSKSKRLKASLGAGYYQLPDVRNYALNKYAMPSYIQLNAELRYAFGGVLTGLETQFLYVSKWNRGETYNDLKYKFNKTDMQQVNWVLNYSF